jgi:hypothetical protein
MNPQIAPQDWRDPARLLRDFAESGFVILESAIRQDRISEICVAYERSHETQQQLGFQSR